MWVKLSEVIRMEAKKVYSKIQSLFDLPPGKGFADAFDAEVKAFHESTKDLPEEKLHLLTRDPTKSLI